MAPMEQQDLRRRSRSEKHQNFSEGVPAGQVRGKGRITSCQFTLFSCTEDLHPERFFRVNIRSESESDPERSSITRWPPESRTAMTMFHLFFFASASAPASTFLACSRLIGAPSGIWGGGGATGCTHAKAYAVDILSCRVLVLRHHSKRRVLQFSG